MSHTIFPNELPLRHSVEQLGVKDGICLLLCLDLDHPCLLGN